MILFSILTGLLSSLVVICCFSYRIATTIFLICTCDTSTEITDKCFSFETSLDIDFALCPNFGSFVIDGNGVSPNSWRYLFSLTWMVSLIYFYIGLLIILGIIFFYFGGRKAYTCVFKGSEDKEQTNQRSDASTSTVSSKGESTKSPGKTNNFLFFLSSVRSVPLFIFFAAFGWDICVALVWLYIYVTGDVQLSGYIVNLGTITTYLSVAFACILTVLLTLKIKPRKSILDQLVMVICGCFGPLAICIIISFFTLILLYFSDNKGEMGTIYIIFITVPIIGIGSPIWTYAIDSLPHFVYSRNLTLAFWNKNYSLKFKNIPKNNFPTVFFNTTIHSVYEENSSDSISIPAYFSQYGGFCHLNATKTCEMEKEILENMLISDVMGASGAAVASDMGKHNINPVIRWTMTVFSFDLGKWFKWEDKVTIFSKKCNSILSFIMKFFAYCMGSIGFILVLIGCILEIIIINSDTETPPTMLIVITNVIIVTATVMLLLELIFASTGWLFLDRVFSFSPYYRFLKDITLSASSIESPCKKMADGGHTDNLGLYPLIVKAKMEKIISIDAGYDRDNTQSGLLESLAQIETHITKAGGTFTYSLDYPATDIRPNDETSNAKRCFNVVRWKWKEENANQVEGVIVYIRTVMIENFDNRIHLYKSVYPEIPHKPTSNPNFTLDEFSTYLLVGEQVIMNTFNGEILNDNNEFNFIVEV